MVREAIGIGDTTEEAFANACKELGVETTDAEFEIIQMPEKKILGIFGGSKAKVKAFIKMGAGQAAAEYLKSIISAMGFTTITMDYVEKEDGVVIDISGDEVGFIIGRRGETMDALQYLTSLIANKVQNSYYKVTINTGDYREKREKTLENLGRKLAIKAIKTGRKCSLEPMNPYERRIIHTAVQKVNGAISWSEGENLNRHIVIGVDPKFKNNRNNRNRGYKKSYNSENKNSVENRERAPINEGGSVGLYGRIDK